MAASEITLLNISATQGGQEVFIRLLERGLSDKASLGDRAELKLTTLLFARPREALLAIWTRRSAPNCAHPICVLNGNRALFASILAPRGNGRRIYIQHSHIFDRQAGRFRPLFRKWLMRLALRGIDSVIRVCDAVFPETLAPGRVFTVHNGVELREFPCREAWRRDPRAPIGLLMVGALTRNKNQRLALDVLARLSDARLVLLGEGPERPHLERACIELGLADRVVWAGQQTDPAPYYRSADLCLMLSEHEGLPFALLESMASGTPVVGFPVGGVAEAIEDGIDGVLVRERSVEALARAISLLAADPDRLRRMGLAARAKIEARFTLGHMVDGFLRVVEETRRRRGVACG